MSHLTDKYPQIKPAPAANTSGNLQKGIKTTGVKTRGNGAAVKGTIARGPMA
jgi:hypothetical protein